MMGWRDYDATLNMMNTIYWHLHYKQDRGQDGVYLLFDRYISYCTHNLIVLPCALPEFLFLFAIFCHRLQIGISKLTGHPCFDDSDHIALVYISCLDTIIRWWKP